MKEGEENDLKAAIDALRKDHEKLRGCSLQQSSCNGWMIWGLVGVFIVAVLAWWFMRQSRSNDKSNPHTASTTKDGAAAAAAVAVADDEMLQEVDPYFTPIEQLL